MFSLNFGDGSFSRTLLGNEREVEKLCKKINLAENSVFTDANGTRFSHHGGICGYMKLTAPHAQFFVVREDNINSDLRKLIREFENSITEKKS